MLGQKPKELTPAQVEKLRTKDFFDMILPDTVKSYIQLCLAINHQALVQKGASQRRTQSANEKYTFRTWLLRLGLIGDEFKPARLHLLKNLDGNIAWKDPAQAEAPLTTASKFVRSNQGLKKKYESAIQRSS